MYKITLGQFRTIWVAGLIVTAILWIWSVNSTSGGIGYFLVGLVIIAFLIFYSLGWRNANPEPKIGRRHEMSELSDEQKKYVESWSWGAAGILIFWALGNKIGKYRWLFLLLYFYNYITARAGADLGVYLLLQIPALIVLIVLGIYGRRLAWKRGTFKDFDEFKKRQKPYDIWGAVVLAVLVASILLVLQLSADSTSRSALVSPTPNELNASSAWWDELEAKAQKARDEIPKISGKINVADLLRALQDSTNKNLK
jgi:hypothetical protein